MINYYNLGARSVTDEPSRGKTNNVAFEQV